MTPRYKYFAMVYEPTLCVKCKSSDLDSLSNSPVVVPRAVKVVEVVVPVEMEPSVLRRKSLVTNLISHHIQSSYTAVVYRDHLVII